MVARNWGAQLSVALARGLAKVLAADYLNRNKFDENMLFIALVFIRFIQSCKVEVKLRIYQ